MDLTRAKLAHKNSRDFTRRFLCLCNSITGFSRSFLCFFLKHKKSHAKSYTQNALRFLKNKKNKEYL